jgi:hypothetical protein
MQRAACTTQHAEPATGNRLHNMQIDNMEQEAYGMHADMCDTETMQQTAVQPGNPDRCSNKRALRTAYDSYWKNATYSMQRATCSVQCAARNII